MRNDVHHLVQNVIDVTASIEVDMLCLNQGNQKSKSESSDSLDSMFDDIDDATSHPELSTVIEPKEVNHAVIIGLYLSF